MAGEAWPGTARRGKARHGMAWQAWQGVASPGRATHGMAGAARRGKAGSGKAGAGFGWARQGLDIFTTQEVTRWQQQPKRMQ
jgi:hypothetical protein